MLELRCPANVESVFVVGNILEIIGLNIFANILVNPDFSISLPMPDHKHKLPDMLIANVMPAWAPDDTAEATCVVVPETTEYTSEIQMIPVKIQLITMDVPPCSGTI